MRLSPRVAAEVAVIKVKGTLRCASCHGEVKGLLECCGACGVLVHADCRRGLGRCPTLGCQAPSAQLEVRAPAKAPLGPSWSAARTLVKGGLVAAALVGGVVWALSTSVCYVPAPKPRALQSGVAREIQDACLLYRLDHGRYPRSMAELLEPSPKGRAPYLEPFWDPHEFFLLRRGETLWIAMEVHEPQRPQDDTIRILRELPPRTSRSAAQRAAALRVAASSSSR